VHQPPELPARVGFAREAVGAEWVFHTTADHAQVQRLSYTGKRISAKWKAEVDAMLLQVRARLRWTPAHPLPIAQHFELTVRALATLARSQ
jgi:hypothetical protein